MPPFLHFSEPGATELIPVTQSSFSAAEVLSPRVIGFLGKCQILYDCSFSLLLCLTRSHPHTEQPSICEGCEQGHEGSRKLNKLFFLLGYFRAVRQEPVQFGEIGGHTQIKCPVVRMWDHNSWEMVAAAQLFPKYFWFIITKRNKEPAGILWCLSPPQSYLFTVYRSPQPNREQH